MTTINLDIDDTITKLTGQHGLDHVLRIREGVERVAALWRVDDGSPEEFQEFCLKYFITDELTCTSLFFVVARSVVGGSSLEIDSQQQHEHDNKAERSQSNQKWPEKCV